MGGERKAGQTELYIMDIATKRIEWHEALLPGVRSYTHFCPFCRPSGRLATKIALTKELVNGSK